MTNIYDKSKKYRLKMEANLAKIGNRPSLRKAVADIYEDVIRDFEEYERSLIHKDKIIATDELTGLYTKKYFRNRLAEEMERAVRYKHPLSLILLDIDHFKRFNDTYGHLEGDKILEQIGYVLKEIPRKEDVVSHLPARNGGEEFAVILPETDEPLPVAKRIKEAAYDIVLPRNAKIKITLSQGYGIYPDHYEGDDYQDFEKLVDNALYKAKNTGRDKICSVADIQSHFKTTS